MNFAGLFSAIRPAELAALQALPWQDAPLPGEAVSAVFSGEVGLAWIGGAMPFIETQKSAPPPAGAVHVKSEILARFLLHNRPLLRSYISAADGRHRLVPPGPAAYIAQVTMDTAGIEAANFAVFLAKEISGKSGRASLLIDADPRNQFIFPLLKLPEVPKLLTEHLQKPSSFKSDLEKCIVPLEKNLSYVNLQAGSLRPFTDEELARLCGFLDMNFDNLVFHTGRFASRWLSENAHVNYAVCAGSFKGEAQALLRHAGGSHTVLIHKAKHPYMPALPESFARQTDPMSAPETETKALSEFTQRVYRARSIFIGSRKNLPEYLECHTGLDLYRYYAGRDDGEAEALLNTLQRKLRARYPRAAFFSRRSLLKQIEKLPHRPATTLLETGSHAQLVSLILSPELRATAIFPAGILPSVAVDGVRISACAAGALVRFRESASRGGFTAVHSAAPYRFAKPGALAAVMEQVQV